MDLHLDGDVIYRRIFACAIEGAFYQRALFGGGKEFILINVFHFGILHYTRSKFPASLKPSRLQCDKNSKTKGGFPLFAETTRSELASTC